MNTFINYRKIVFISTLSVFVTTPILYQCLGEDKKLKAVAYSGSLNEIWHEDTIKIVGAKY